MSFAILNFHCTSSNVLRYIKLSLYWQPCWAFFNKNSWASDGSSITTFHFGHWINQLLSLYIHEYRVSVRVGAPARDHDPMQILTPRTVAVLRWTLRVLLWKLAGVVFWPASHVLLPLNRMPCRVRHQFRHAQDSMTLMWPRVCV